MLEWLQRRLRRSVGGVYDALDNKERMGHAMDDTVKRVFGQPSGASVIDPSEGEDKDRSSKEFWRNLQRRKKIRRRLLDNTHFLFDEEIFSPNDGNFSSDRGERETFRIASIGTFLRRDDEDTDGKPAQLKIEQVNGGGMVVLADGQSASDLVDVRTRQLATALNHEPDFVSFCEFAFPPIEESQVSEEDRRDLFSERLEQTVDGLFTDQATTMLTRAKAESSYDKEHLPFICLGSAHCMLNRYNIGVVAPGGEFENGWRMRRRRTNPFQTDRHKNYHEELGEGPIIHKKRTPARRAGERARVPEAHGFRLYRHELGLIAVLICSDAMDINQFANIMRHNLNADLKGDRTDRIFLTLIPAYNLSSILMDACRDLSLSARTNVLVTNAMGESQTQVLRDMGRSENLPRSEFFFMGRNSSQLASANAGVVLRNFLDSNIWFLDVDLRAQNHALSVTREELTRHDDIA